MCMNDHQISLFNKYLSAAKGDIYSLLQNSTSSIYSQYYYRTYGNRSANNCKSYICSLIF